METEQYCGFELVKDESRLDLFQNALKMFWKELTRKRRKIYVHRLDRSEFIVEKI